jgi:ribonuclease P protein component
VYAGERKAVRRHLVVYAAPRPDASLPTRMGLTASRKLGDSVRRNRFRRQLRDIFRRHHALLEPGHDLVVNARVAAAGASSDALRRDFLSCLRDLGILKSPPPPPPA